MYRFISAVLAAGLVAACAPVTRQPVITDAAAQKEAELQKELALKRMHELDQRLENVYWPIAVKNAELCGEHVKRWMGLTVTTLDKVPEDFRSAFKHVYATTPNHATVTGVTKGAPAEAAGVREGDQIDATLWKNLAQQKGQVIFLDLQRDGKPVKATITPVLACGYPAQLQSDSTVNAYANGKGIVVNTGLMDFVKSDEELALVLGHELAHNTMGHLDKKRTNQLIGTILGATLSVLSGVDVTQTAAQIGAGAYSQAFEDEADYVGTYYVARAGYDVTDAAMMWRRMGVANPNSIQDENSDHPSSAKRFLGIDQTAKEIAQKRAEGRPLLPDLKPESSSQPADTPDYPG